ncbi:MAG: hypothetical protein Q7S65_03835 [Nanoarchaeota archaeon]|nr:hypothetical protein [Nanoarchaeota archaeon]
MPTAILEQYGPAKQGEPLYVANHVSLNGVKHDADLVGYCKEAPVTVLETLASAGQSVIYFRGMSIPVSMGRQRDRTNFVLLGVDQLPLPRGASVTGSLSELYSFAPDERPVNVANIHNRYAPLLVAMLRTEFQYAGPKEGRGLARVVGEMAYGAEERCKADGSRAAAIQARADTTLEIAAATLRTPTRRLDPKTLERLDEILFAEALASR